LVQCLRAADQVFIYLFIYLFIATAHPQLFQASLCF